MNLLVVGAGEMGRWFARHSGVDAVAFTDTDRDTAVDAANTVDIASTVVNLNDDDEFDIVCLAVPIPTIPDAIATHAPKATTAVVDISGEMQSTVTALQTHADGRERASFHPLFSTRNAPGNIPVVIDENGPAITGIIDALSTAGNQVFETTPQEHDAAMETSQARTHTAVLAYALAAEDIDPRFHTPISSGLTDLVEQVTNNSPDVYADIQDRFEGSDSVAEAAAALTTADRETFLDLYEDAGR